MAAFKKNVRAGMGKVAIVKLADEVMFLLAFSFLYRMNILTIEVGFNELFVDAVVTSGESVHYSNCKECANSNNENDNGMI